MLVVVITCVVVIVALMAANLRQRSHLQELEALAVSYTHLTLPTIYSV